MNEQLNQDDVIPHGEAIVERFGGIRPMASKLNVPVTTVQGWKKRDAIPAIRRDEILLAAANYDINLKGLISESANQNARIAEDPALSSAPRPIQMAQPAPQTVQPQRETRAQRLDNFQGVDIRQVKRTARRTSFITSACVAALIVAGGFLLFGGDVKHVMDQSARINTLDGRVTSLEGRAPVSASGNSALSAGGLQQQISDLSNSVSSRLNALEAQLSGGVTAAAPAVTGMVDRLQGMMQAPGGTTNLQSAVGELRSVVDGLQGHMNNLDSALTDVKTQNTTLSQALADVSGRDLSAAAMLLTLVQMREAADRQTPFADDLALLKQMAGTTDPALAASIDKMAPYAQTGILSPGGLKRELQASANDIITAKLRGEDVSMKEKIMARLQSLFSIKKDGVPVAGSAEHETIQKAQAQLDANDVAGALATMQSLSGPSAEAAAPWEAKAGATLAAQSLDQELVSAVVNKIKTGLGGLANGSGAAPLSGVINAGPINMAPAQAAPAEPTPEATPAPQSSLPNVAPMAGDATPAPTLTPQPEPSAPAVTIQQ